MLIWIFCYNNSTNFIVSLLWSSLTSNYDQLTLTLLPDCASSEVNTRNTFAPLQITGTVKTENPDYIFILIVLHSLSLYLASTKLSGIRLVGQIYVNKNICASSERLDNQRLIIWLIHLEKFDCDFFFLAKNSLKSYGNSQIIYTISVSKFEFFCFFKKMKLDSNKFLLFVIVSY